MHERLDRPWRKRMRKRLWRKQKHCRWCKRRFDEPVKTTQTGMPIWVIGQFWPTLDHVKPLGQGGTNLQSNLTLACSKCNHDRNL